jgi:hypothetical protein
MSTFIEKARRTLLEMAHEGSRLVTDYSDSRLTGILNVYSAAQIVREILNNSQALGDIARMSYTHSNGFDKITLISNGKPEFKLRLHIWWPRRRSEQNTELIHNHRWLFTSTTLCGSAQVETFTEKDSGEPMCRHEYFPRDDALEKYDLKFVGLSRLASDLMVKLTPGSTYSMGPDLFHRVLWEADLVSMTMFVRWESIRSTAAVFSGSVIEDEQILSVPSFAPDQLRSKLESVLRELGC